MDHTDTALPLDTPYRRGIPIVVVDPAERAIYAARPFAFGALNDATLPSEPAARARFIADLEQFLRTGDPGGFVVVEENLRRRYLVDIGAPERITRRVFATHPLLPDKLLVIGGVGVARPDEPHGRLTLHSPMPGTTLHRYFPTLSQAAMSAGRPTPAKGIRGAPNVDPLGGLSPGVAETKYRHVQMIAEGRGGIDPAQFPVIANVAWGTVGDDVAFYVYALPGQAIPVTELLHASDAAGTMRALQRYLRTGSELLRGLRHLHDVGYVFSQAHQGNVYVYPDEGVDRIVIADLDTLQSVRDFSRRTPKGEYLSPRAFANLVNLRVACTNVAHIAWIDFMLPVVRASGGRGLPDVGEIQASIVHSLLTAYLGLREGPAHNAIHHGLRQYYADLARRAPDASDPHTGVARLQDGDLYDTDVFGSVFTYTLMNAAYCRQFGARALSEGLTRESVMQLARPALARTPGPHDAAAIARASDEIVNRVIRERASDAMQELTRADRARSRGG